VAEVDGKLTGLGADPHRLKTLIEIGMKNVRDQVLTDIAQFQLRNRYADPKPINDWLAASKDRYAAWLGRL
jgi:hypothetical protein